MATGEAAAPDTTSGWGTADIERLGVPILGELTGQAYSDGGDRVWLDAKTLLVGRGYRTNDAAPEVAVKGDGGPTCLTQPLWRG